MKAERREMFQTGLQDEQDPSLLYVLFLQKSMLFGMSSYLSHDDEGLLPTSVSLQAFPTSCGSQSLFIRHEVAMNGDSSLRSE